MLSLGRKLRNLLGEFAIYRGCRFDSALFFRLVHSILFFHVICKRLRCKQCLGERVVTFAEFFLDTVIAKRVV